MTYIPTVPHVPSSSPVSARARRLAGHLDETIERFQRESPGMDPQEVRQALDIVRQSHQGSGPTTAGIAVALGLLMAVGVFGLVMVRGGFGSPVLLIGIVAGLAGLLAVGALAFHGR